MLFDLVLLAQRALGDLGHAAILVRQGALDVAAHDVGVDRQAHVQKDDFAERADQRHQIRSGSSR